MARPRVPSRQAFTLVELLVVMGIIAALMGILLPALGNARSVGRRIACASNLRQVGAAVQMYANVHRGCIPFGPKAPPFTGSNFYPSTGAVTSLISLETGDPVALGLLLDNYLANAKRVLFCPDPDQGDHADWELSKVGVKQAQGDYFYRHGSGADIYSDAGTEHIRLAHLGFNRNGRKIAALAMDANYVVEPNLALFGVQLRTFHRARTVNVLFSGGEVLTLDNRDDAFTVDARDDVRQSFDRMLRALERADEVMN